MSRSVQRTAAPAASLPIFHVTRYDPETREPLGLAVPVEAPDKTAAARQVCGFKVAGGAGPRTATASVIALGDAPNRREYFSRA